MSLLQDHEVRTANRIVTYRLHPDFERASTERDAAMAILQTAAYGGYDPARKRHPSHFAVVQPLERAGERDPHLIQIASIWMEPGTLYQDQLSEIAKLGKRHRVGSIYYDSTHGDLQALQDMDELPDGFAEVYLSGQTKSTIAGMLNTRLERGTLTLLPDERQQKNILQVNNLLQAEETELGHGDSFWSLALAVYAYQTEGQRRGSMMGLLYGSDRIL